MHRHFQSERINELRTVYDSLSSQVEGTTPQISKTILYMCSVVWDIIKIPSNIIYDDSCKDSISKLKASWNGIIISNHTHVFDVPIITSILLKYIWFDHNIFCITQKNLISSFVAEKCWGISIFQKRDLKTMERSQVRQAVQENKRIFDEVIPDILASYWNYLAVFPQGERKEKDDFTIPERHLRNIYSADIPFLLVKLLYSQKTRKLKADTSVYMDFLDSSEVKSFEDFKKLVDDFYL